MKRKTPSRRSRSDAKSFVSPSPEELGLFDPQPMRIPDPGFGNYEKYLKAYADEVWVYACVSRRAADVASTPIILVDRSSGKAIDKHPVLDLLNRPNPRMKLTRRGFLWWLDASLLLAGNGYYLMDELKGKLPTSLWPLIPSLVQPIPDKDPKVFLKRYDYHVGGSKIPLSTELCHQIQFPNPLSYFEGMPPLAAARMSVDTHRASTRYNLRFFDNSARPDLVFKTPHSLTAEQRKRMAVIWMKRHRGEDKAHLPAFLEKGTEAQLIGLNQKDMDFIEQKKMSREEICSAYQVPPALVGLFEYANYANAQEQERIYQRSTVVPDAQSLCEFLTGTLLPLFDPKGSYEFRVDTSAIKALQEDQDKQSQYIDRYWKMGVPLNQLVKSYKLPFGEVKGIGDISFVNGSATKADGTPLNPPPAPMIPGQDPSEPDADEEETPKPPKPVKSKAIHPTLAQRKAKHNAMLAKADSLSVGMRSAIRAEFDRQRDSVLAAVQAAGEGEKPSRAALKIDTAASTKALAEAMAPHMKLSVYAGNEIEGKLIRDLSKKFDPVHRKDPSRIDKWVSKNAFKWAGEMNATTLARIDKIIEDGLANGESISEISEALSEAFDVERDYRTDRAAQTEVIASLNQGALEAYQDNPQVQGKGWLATEDEATRDSHRQAGAVYNELNPIPVNEPFQVGNAAGLAPGQTGDPSEDINCRCSIFPVVIPQEN